MTNPAAQQIISLFTSGKHRDAARYMAPEALAALIDSEVLSMCLGQPDHCNWADVRRITREIREEVTDKIDPWNTRTS